MNLGIFFSFIFAVLFVGCSGKSGTTNAKLQLSVGKFSSAELVDYATGGGMLYGLNTSSGDRFAININDVPLSAMELANGQWEFYGMLWENGADPTFHKMEGKIRCSYIKQTLDGGEIDISLNFSNSNCNHGRLATNTYDDSGSVHFLKFNTYICSKKGVQDLNDECSSSEGEFGQMGSIRVSLETYAQGVEGEVGSSLTSTCYNSNPSDGVFEDEEYVKMGLNMPNGPAPMRVKMEVFSMSDCDPSGGLFNIIQNEGYAKESPNIDSKLYGTTDQRIFISLSDEQRCAKIAPGVEGFTGGDGSISSPFGICNEAQFNSVSANSILLSKSYQLLRDLNFSQNKSMIDTNSMCAGFVTSVIPFGGLYGTCLPLSSQITGPMPYSATFDGRGHTIKAPIIKEESMDTIGLFRILGSGAVVKNLKIENAMMSANNMVGVVAGQINGGAQVYNITIVNSEVEAYGDRAGGVVGSLNGEVRASVVLASEVSARYGNIGGIAGDLITGSIIGVAFDGLVEHKDNGSANAGGIAGAISTGAINGAIVRGAIIGTGNNIGGVVGRLDSGSVLNFDVNAAIVSSYSDPSQTGVFNTGGVVGYSGSIGNTVSFGLFRGQVNANCTNTCRVSEAVGNDSADVVSVFSISDDWVSSSSNIDPTNIYTEADLKVSSNYTGFDTDSASDIYWIISDGSFPKLHFDNDKMNPCILAENQQSVGNQVGASRGTSSNPIGLCYASQFKDVKLYPNKSYTLLNNLNLKDLVNTDYVTNFTGELQGNYRVIMGANKYLASAGDFSGLFEVNFGVIKNLNLIGSKLIIESGFTGDIGHLVSKNTGTIDSVNVIGHEFDMVPDVAKVGSIAGVNEGHILFSETDRMIKFGFDSNLINFGGLVGQNKAGGVIEKSSSRLFVKIEGLGASQSIDSVGGLVGENSGTIQEVFYAGRLEFDNVDGENPSIYNVGGIAGTQLASGTLLDSYTSGYSRIHTAFTTNVGGLIGNADGQVSRSFNGAEVITAECTYGDFYTLEKSYCGGTWVGDNVASSSSGALFGTGSPSTSNNYFFSEPFQILEVRSVNVATSTMNLCTILMDGAVNAFTESDADFAFFNNHNRFVPIGSLSGTSLTFSDNDTNDLCTYIDNNSANISFVKSNAVSSGGVLLNTSDEFDYTSFSGFDMISDIVFFPNETIDTSSYGYPRLIGLFEYYLMKPKNAPRVLPTNYPKFILEPSSTDEYDLRLPEHGWDW